MLLEHLRPTLMNEEDCLFQHTSNKTKENTDFRDQRATILITMRSKPPLQQLCKRNLHIHLEQRGSTHHSNLFCVLRTKLRMKFVFFYYFVPEERNQGFYPHRQEQAMLLYSSPHNY